MQTPETYAAAQARLNALGASPPLAVDGAWGPKSSAALKQYQAAHGLTVDGILGPQSIASLKLAAGGSATTGSASKVPVIDPPTFNYPPGTVPDRITPITPAQAAKALSDGYKIVTGKRPAKNVMQLLVGQSAFETENWHAIHNYNFGNKKASSGDRNWQYFRCSEIVDGQEVFYDPPAWQCRFAAYRSAAEGGAAYIQLLKEHTNWWNGLHSGTPEGFVQGLTMRPGAYFTASPSVYLNGLMKRMNDYAAIALQFAESPVGIGGFIALALGVALFMFRKSLHL